MLFNYFNSNIYIYFYMVWKLILFISLYCDILKVILPLINKKIKTFKLIVNKHV